MSTPEELLKNIEAERKRLPKGSDEDRASRLYIMKTVVIIYAVILLSLVSAIFIGALITKEWNTATKSLSDVATTFVLPVLTLVLGYYFGREGREKDLQQK